jgi:predicted ATPase
MATRVSSTSFAGRGEQLAELCSALDDAASARPSLAFLAGRSGAGKTRLISELASRARERILAKLDVRSRTEAAALAHRQGLIGFAV